MSKIFFASDHHLGHANIITFKDSKGQLLRPFPSIEVHDKLIIDTHNMVVEDDDLTYFLGDIVWKTNKKAQAMIASMKGRKRACAGNHDDLDFLFSTSLFERVYLWKYFPEYSLIASHVPLAENDLKRAGRNVHGHTHNLSAVTANYAPHSLGKYANVSMENIKYKPRELDEVLVAINSGIRFT